MIVNGDTTQSGAGRIVRAEKGFMNLQHSVMACTIYSGRSEVSYEWVLFTLRVLHERSMALTILMGNNEDDIQRGYIDFEPNAT